MKTDTITHKDCSIHIHTDECPENPFEAWDCEPPLLTYYGGRHGSLKAYQDAPDTLRAILHLLPVDTWERGKRMAFFREFMADKFGLKEVTEEIRRQGSTFEAIADLLSAEYGDKPQFWNSALEWFELAAALLKHAGIPCLYEHSTGYCQGDVTLCLVILTPEWFTKSGAHPEASEAICKSAVELYSAWAWGDVYGFTCEDENGDEIGDHGASVWGFYGRDHEESGLMDAARDAIDSFLAKRNEETASLESALCAFA